MIQQSFWQLLNEQGVEIPPIQRDYAQGRQSGRIPGIRKKFIEAIFKALQSNTPLSLDFVYGKIFGQKNEAEQRRNLQSIEALIAGIRDYATTLDIDVSKVAIEEKLHIPGTATYLIPLDGQQRLTTLFLVHWYILSRLNKIEQLQILKRFRYKTRKSSEDFLALLCNSSRLNFGLPDLAEQLCGLESFSNTWLDDPTVNSLLTVAQEIHAYCMEGGITDETLRRYWTVLAENSIVHFDFLNLRDFNLSDELYVKMNARGKQLTEFENFKAWLFGKIEHDGWYPEEQWQVDAKRFEVEWNDLFWTFKDPDVFEVDAGFFRYFKLQYLIDKVRIADAKGSTFTNPDQRELIDSITTGAADFDFEKNFSEEFGNRLPVYFAFLETCASQLPGNSREGSIASFASFFFNGRKPFQWIELIRSAIVSIYLEVNASHGLGSDHFIQYQRVVNNLFNNQTFDGASLYKRALNSIHVINDAIKDADIFSWLRELNPKADGYVFTQEQLEEEKRKALLIESDVDDREHPDSWYNLIVAAEAHSYFSAKIGFLLELAGDDKTLFKSYYRKIAPLFSDQTLSHNDYLFQRALLTFGNYFIDKGWDKVSFCKNDRNTYRDRNENWLRVLTDAKKLSLLTQLVQDIDYDPTDLENSLKSIITRRIDEEPVEEIIRKPIRDINYWDLYLHCPRLFDYGQSSIIRIHDGRYAYQLNASTTGGYFNDVLCEFVKLQYYSEDDQIATFRVQGWDKAPFLLIDGRIQVDVDTTSDCFLLEDDDLDEAQCYSILELRKFIKRINRS